MLKQRPAGDKSWPVACSQTTLGEDGEELDLRGAHLSYGDFKDATFQATGAIRLNGAGLANADLSGSTFTADTSYGSYEVLIDFTEANLANADLSGSTLTATSFFDALIDFAEANLANADLSGSTLTADSVSGNATINFTAANLANADLSGWNLTADTIVGLAPPPLCADKAKACKVNKCTAYSSKKKQKCQTTCGVAPPENKCNCFKEDAKKGSKKCKIKNCKKPKSAQKCKDKCKKDGKKKKPLCQKTCCNAS